MSGPCVNLCGDRVRNERLRLRLTQETLAARVQVNEVMLSRDMISKIEHGWRCVTDIELVALADALDVSVCYLLGVDV